MAHSVASMFRIRAAAILLAAFACPVFGAQPFVLGSPPTLLTGLVTIADQKGYFLDQGLDLKVMKLPTGDDGLRAINAGRVDAYVVGDVPFVKHLENNADLRIIATLGEWGNETRLITRKDSGIRGGADLRGKRIGVQKGSAFHYFLDLLLARNGMTEVDVKPVFLHTKEQPRALTDGRIDAAVSREPYLGQARQGLGEASLTLEFPGLMIKRFVLVTTQDRLKSRPDSLVALLRGLVSAEKSLRENPDDAAALFAGHGLGKAREIRGLFKEMRLRLSLDNHLLYTLEKIAEWWRGVQGREQSHGTNYLDVLVSTPMQAAKPHGVLLNH